MLTDWSFCLIACILMLQTVSGLMTMQTNVRGNTGVHISPLNIRSPLLIRGLRGGNDNKSSPEDVASDVSIKFLKRNVSDLQSYLSYLQEYQNPMVARAWPANTNFVSVTETVTDTVFRNSLRAESKGLVYREWVRAGPRKQTLFTPSEVNAAIVACGGLDPGINVVVREICSTLDFAYNVRRAWGVRYGWRGFTDKAAQDWIELTPERVDHVHKEGGSILGFSTDPCDVEAVLDCLQRRGVNQLYVMGNVDACRSAHAIQQGAVIRKMKLSVVAVPKSIQNNFPFIDKCIGFDTVVQGAVEAIDKVVQAARSVQGGIGIIKLGSGEMCLNAVLASGDADVCLIKSVAFDPRVVFEYVQKVVLRKGFVIIVVEDGAGEETVKKWRAKLEADGSSRAPVGGSMDECTGKLLVPQGGLESKWNAAHFDVGQYLKEYAYEFFSATNTTVTVRLSTPEWYIRSMPAFASDRIYCSVLSSNAVHAAFAGLTDLVVGRMNQRHVYIPLDLVIDPKNAPLIKETSRIYNRMIRTTRQPSFQRLGQAKLITGRGDVRRAFNSNEALAELKGAGGST